MIALGGVSALVSMIARFRRSRGEERQQLRWLAAAALLLLLSIVALVVTGILAGPDGTSAANDAAALVMILVAAIGLPLACAVAILRYRLYDLDLVIRKAAVYTIVAIVLTVVYAAALAIAALSFLGSVSGRRPVRPHLQSRATACAAGRRTDRVRHARHPVRGAQRVLRARGRDVLDRRGPASDGRAAGGQHRRHRGARVAASGGDARPGGRLARRPRRARRHARHRGPAATCGGCLVVPGHASGRAPGRHHPAPARQRSDGRDEGAPGDGPRLAGGPRAAQRAPGRGPPRLAPADRERAGRARQAVGARHPRRCAAAAGGVGGEAPARRHDGRPRHRGRARAPRPAPGGSRRRAREPARPGARDLPAAAGRQGAAGGPRRSGTQVGRSGHAGHGRCRPLSARGRGGRLLLLARSAEQHREVLRRPRGSRSGSRSRTDTSRSRSATTAPGSTRRRPRTAPGSRGWPTGSRRSADRSRSRRRREPAPRSADRCRSVRAHPAAGAAASQAASSRSGPNADFGI